MSDLVQKANAENLFVQDGEVACASRDVGPDIPQSFPAPLARQEFESAPRSVEQTGDILNRVECHSRSL